MSKQGLEALRFRGGIQGRVLQVIDDDGNVRPVPFENVGSVRSGTFLLEGGQVVWDGELAYTVTAAHYYIDGEPYESLQQQITLGAADGTFDRVDVIALDTTGTVVAVPGTPAIAPAEPVLDPEVHLKLSSVYVATGSTTPDASTEFIYDENAEWQTETNAAARINFVSADNPRDGIRAIEGTAAQHGDRMDFIRPSGSVDLATQDNLVFYLRLKDVWPQYRKLRFRWFNEDDVVGTVLVLTRGSYGVDYNLPDIYQTVVIPTGTFGVTGGVTKLRLEVAGGAGDAVGFFIDSLQLQAGGSVPTSPTRALYRGPWSSAQTYLTNDIVLYSSQTYIAKTGSVNAQPDTSTAEWASIGGTGGTGSGLSYQGTWNANTNTPTIPAAATANKGWYYLVSVAGTTNINGITDWGLNDWVISNGVAWQKIDNSETVTSVASKTGAVTLVPTDITGLTALLDAKAALASPTFTGDPKVPTASPGDNDTSAASTGFVQQELAGYIPKTLADAKGDIVVATGPDTFVRKPAGTNDYALIADDTQPDGLDWRLLSADGWVFWDPDAEFDPAHADDDEFDVDDLASYSAINTGGLTTFDVNTTAKSRLYAACPASAGATYRGWMKALPVGDFCAWTKCSIAGHHGNYQFIGLTLSSTNTIVGSGSHLSVHLINDSSSYSIYAQYGTSAGFAQPGSNLIVQRWMDIPFVYIRMRRVGTTIFCTHSPDGKTWAPEASIAEATVGATMGYFGPVIVNSSGQPIAGSWEFLRIKASGTAVPLGRLRSLGLGQTGAPGPAGPAGKAGIGAQFGDGTTAIPGPGYIVSGWAAWDGTVTTLRLMSDVNCSAVVNIKKNGTTIFTSVSKLTLSSSSQDFRTDMTGIVTAVAEGDEFTFELETLSGTPTRLTVMAFIARS